MIERAQVIGAGRVGSAMAARLRERGLDLSPNGPELVLLCVPDRAIAEVAEALEPGPWVAHVSGATPLAALAPHERRFGLHPLQTFTRGRGAEQLDGAFAAVTAETDEARDVGDWLARTLRSRSQMGNAPPTTPARRSPPTISSRCAAPRARCSRPRVRPRRRSTR